MEALVGGDGPQNDVRANRGNRRGQQVEENGMIVPAAMRNYQERDILCGFATLKRYDRIDLCWGFFKGVERDLLRSQLFVLTLVAMIITYIVASSDVSK